MHLGVYIQLLAFITALTKNILYYGQQSLLWRIFSGTLD
jgi:hypothetical protein